ncbi:MAG: indole-3-glycerol phosphate synthase TrpC [Candidatus Omnitrophica bacterium]|nr:indole-3-glycerol phosphate synthase TrpC [Candidatus Omnitrophota bacterium]
MAKDALKEIVARKKEKILLARQAFPEEELKIKVLGLPETRPFREAIVKPRTISLIAEIKKASPSKGVIREDFAPAAIAKVYQDAGVQAISVLTEEDHFQGNITYLNEVKNVTTVPVLRKDFILEAYQIYESRWFGADAILLIADLLTRDQLNEFMGLADSLGLDYIVEVHTEKELKKVLNLEVPVIGINNRNLHTLEVDAKTTEELFILVPKDKAVIVESGIKTAQDVLFLKILGVSAVLIGEAFMQSPDIGKKVQELMGW